MSNLFFYWTLMTIMRRSIYILFFCFLLGSIAGAIIQAQNPTLSERISRLEDWRARHQPEDDKQFQMLARVDAQLAATAIDREHRLTLLENEYVNLATELSGLQWKLWGLLAGVVAQLIHIVYSVLSSKVSSKIAEEAAKHRRPQ